MYFNQYISIENYYLLFYIKYMSNSSQTELLLTKECETIVTEGQGLKAVAFQELFDIHSLFARNLQGFYRDITVEAGEF